MKATFHERQYELAVNLELIAGSGMFFAPMQVIEESVGFDIALVPGHTAVWSKLGIGASPAGVETAIAYDAKLDPVPGGQTFSASLFIQYKRPERMKRRSAAEAEGRRSQGGGVPFFRVRLNEDQHGVLAELEKHVGSNAVVRYAAPLFDRIEDLWVRQSTRKVFSGSTFIAPSQAGDPPSCWTYDDYGSPIFCSEPRRGAAERSDDILRAIVRMATDDRPTRDAHLRELAVQVSRIDFGPNHQRRIDGVEDRGRYRELEAEAEWVRPPMDRSEWRERLHAVAPQRTDAEIDAAVDGAVIANAIESVGITWLLAEIRPRVVEQ